MDGMDFKGQIAKCASCGWLSMEKESTDEADPSKEVTCGMCLKLREIQNASQEVARELYSRLDGMHAEIQQAAEDKSRIAQLEHRVRHLEEEKVTDAAKLHALENKVAALEERIAQFEASGTTTDRHTGSEENRRCADSGAQQGMTPLGVDGDADSENTEARGGEGNSGNPDLEVQAPISGNPGRVQPPEEKGSPEETTGRSPGQQSRIRPPEGVLREVLVVGDGNVGRVAAALVREVGLPDSIEFLYKRGATTMQAHEFVAGYEGQAREVTRSYVLHVGLNDVLRGEADQLIPRLEETWKGKETSLIVCSVPEVTAKGREVQAKAVLVNEQLHAWCKRSGAHFLDLAKVQSPGCFDKDGLRYSSEGGQQVARLIAEAVTPFLGVQRPKAKRVASDRRGGRNPSTEALWKAVERLVEGRRQHLSPAGGRKWR